MMDLTEFRRLYVKETQVTGEGDREVQQAVPKRKIE